MPSIPIQVTSGSQTANVGSEHTLVTITGSPGIYALAIDCNALVNGDIVEVWAAVNVTDGGTKRVLMKETRGHAQANPTLMFPPIPIMGAVDFVLKQTDGTGRAFPFEVIQL